jgi:hypothetical protein
MLLGYQHAVEEYLEPVARGAQESVTVARTEKKMKRPKVTSASSQYPEMDFLKEVLTRTSVFILFLIAAMYGRVVLDFVVVAIFGHHTPPESVGMIIRVCALIIIALNCALFAVHLVNASKRLIAHS